MLDTGVELLRHIRVRGIDLLIIAIRNNDGYQKAILDLEAEALLSRFCRYSIYSALYVNSRIQLLVQAHENYSLDCGGYDSHNAHGTINTHRDNESRSYFKIRYETANARVEEYSYRRCQDTCNWRRSNWCSTQR